MRYYDEIGLLRPARVGANGYRYYDRRELLRLQQILLLRELGLDLTTIGGVVDAEHDPIEALRHHYRRLLDERERLHRLAGTVAVTIKHLEDGTDMPAENLFEAMTPERAEYLAGLPKKRTAAGTLFSDELGRTLLVEPTYRPYWLLPGAVVGADESPWAWFTDDELHDRLPAHMLRRTRAALQARAEGATLYLENGSIS